MIILSTESVFSAVGGVLFGIDQISFVGYIGCVIIFVGIIVGQVDFRALKGRHDKDVEESEDG